MKCRSGTATTHRAWRHPPPLHPIPYTLAHPHTLPLENNPTIHFPVLQPTSQNSLSPPHPHLLSSQFLSSICHPFFPLSVAPGTFLSKMPLSLPSRPASQTLWLPCCPCTILSFSLLPPTFSTPMIPGTCSPLRTSSPFVYDFYVITFLMLMPRLLISRRSLSGAPTSFHGSVRSNV